MQIELNDLYTGDPGSQDQLILVDSNDSILGYSDKIKCHRGEGILHRAFSIFLFNSRGKLLLQQRSASKPLWPFFWSNSVCSHPRKGENSLEAAERRLKEEIGIEAHLRFLFKFQYQASYKNAGSENELCSVFIGKSNAPIVANRQEIAEWCYVNLEELNKDLKVHPNVYTPWLKKEWQIITQNHMRDIESLQDS